MKLRILKLRSLCAYLPVLGILFLTTCQSRVESAKFSTAINGLATDASMIPGNFVATSSTGKSPKIKIKAQLESRVESKSLVIDEGGYYLNPDINASFPGGEKKLEEYLSDHFDYHSSTIHDSNYIEIDLAVDEEGNLHHVSVDNNKPGYDLADASIELVLNMPKWNPAKHQNRPVKTYQKLLIEYQFKR